MDDKEKKNGRHKRSNEYSYLLKLSNNEKRMLDEVAHKTGYTIAEAIRVGIICQYANMLDKGQYEPDVLTKERCSESI